MAVGPVTFNYDYWVAQAPAFAGCSQVQGQAWFDLATTLCPNTAANPLGDLTSQALYLLTSHVAWLNAPRDAAGRPAQSGSPPPGVVGRISSASEGSVSVSSEWQGGTVNQAWFLQTQWGAMYWQMSSPLRTMRYAARPTVVANGAFPSRRW